MHKRIWLRLGLRLSILLMSAYISVANLTFEFSGSCRPITGRYQECYVSCLPGSKEDMERLHQAADYIGLNQGGWNQFSMIEPNSGCSQDMWRKIIGASMLYCKPETIKFSNCKLGGEMLRLITLHQA
ncbi:hypothetical protein K493DRAFT_381992 [Basidiobolus meristosporus CBS 931.73]|uniref:Uncharacterized protein n=1 Tax=Basidiobolus meristosporus CBS 931.73 TaxID=1314790 RepID=A0A1Y1XWW8_9FUNG|nr:hypothetical protein K493DRAFT_381992 [Basidiobolus meristosporus CBS 931.73]|eukprot:ORX89844.1 hypothetical protein K493DRAFT_381992 [Basidiobolus meristosporus CBS 931.73]